MSNHHLRLDAAAQTRAAALVAPVAAAYALYLASHPEVTPVTIDLAYVETGAVTVGLNYWRDPSLWAPGDVVGVPPDQPTIPTFDPVPGVGTSTIAVDVTAADDARAAALIAALRGTPSLVNVLGCACCTGLALLSGVLAVRGPFV